MQPDDGKDFPDMMGRVQDGESVTGLTCVAIERDESGKPGGVDAGDFAKIERDIVFAHHRHQAFKQARLIAPHQFLDPVQLNYLAATGTEL